MAAAVFGFFTAGFLVAAAALALLAGALAVVFFAGAALVVFAGAAAFAGFAGAAFALDAGLVGGVTFCTHEVSAYTRYEKHDHIHTSSDLAALPAGLSLTRPAGPVACCQHDHRKECRRRKHTLGEDECALLSAVGECGGEACGVGRVHLKLVLVRGIFFDHLARNTNARSFLVKHNAFL